MSQRHDQGARRAAADLFSRGFGKTSVARRLGISRSIVEHWIQSYRSVGEEVFLEMGGTRREYGWETKVSAASAVVDSGRSKPEVMREYGIASKSPLNSWCASYRAGGAEALRPRPKGRPRSVPAPATREEELEREIERLRAQVAYLKKSIALKAGPRSGPGSGPRP